MTEEDSAWEKTTIERAFARAVAAERRVRELEAELAAMRAHSLGCTCGNCPKTTPPVVTLPVVPETCGECAHCVRNLYSPSATLGCSYNKPWTVVDATEAPPSWCPKSQKP